MASAAGAGESRKSAAPAVTGRTGIPARGEAAAGSAGAKPTVGVPTRRAGSPGVGIDPRPGVWARSQRSRGGPDAGRCDRNP